MRIAFTILLLLAAVSFTTAQKSPKGSDLLMQLEAEFAADVVQQEPP